MRLDPDNVNIITGRSRGPESLTYALSLAPEFCSYRRDIPCFQLLSINNGTACANINRGETHPLTSANKRVDLKGVGQQSLS
jgi:hypothetical protein